MSLFNIIGCIFVAGGLLFGSFYLGIMFDDKQKYNADFKSMIHWLLDTTSKALDNADKAKPSDVR